MLASVIRFDAVDKLVANLKLNGVLVRHSRIISGIRYEG